LSVIWLRNIETEKPMPINPLPDASGNIVLLSDGLHFRVCTNEVKRDLQRNGEEFFTSHFSTCPCADEFRKAKK
jgi:hypothetical protein